MIGLAAGAVLALTGCSDDGTPGAAPTPTTTAAPDPGPSASPDAPGPAEPEEPTAEPTTAPTADPGPTADARAAVTPSLSFAGLDGAGTHVEVNAYVAEVVEPGGTCTAVLTSGAGEVRTTADAEPDATTTTCAPLRTPVADLAAGTWSVVVEYSSPTSVGTSAPSIVEVA